MMMMLLMMMMMEEKEGFVECNLKTNPQKLNMKKIPIILIIFNLISIYFSFFSIMCLSTWGWYGMRLLLCSGWERCTNGLCNNQTNTIYSFLMSTARHRLPDRRTHHQTKAHAKDGRRSRVYVGRSTQSLLTLPHLVSRVL